ncbi:hypothetical protein AQUSIP_01140 [Aquicella siphonis]|uniref:Uncharacterized protein n=1 Tax=Aquicella siphonis TaxID=254247 RepID=A0A5E4PE52_9COXI|nr:hypothetical protein [Aquicella siphonis]VVC74842.1 hypothetical protein AQUSIP_01140 [Aquicella siphonis]
MPYLNSNQLEVALDKIFEYMETKGVKFDPEKKEEFKKRIAQDLHNQLSHDDIKDVNVQKKLISCISSLAMGKQKEYDNMVDRLKSDEKNTPDPKLEKKLTLEMILLATLTKLMDPEQKKKMELKPDEFKKKMVESAKENDKSPDKEKNAEALGKQLDDTLRNLYGGDNPTINGEIQFPILGPTFGNLTGLTNQASADPNAVSKMVDDITANPGKADYQGLENTALIRDLGEGVDLSAALSPTLRAH